MTKQKSPHTQTQQDVEPEQTDLEPHEEPYEADAPADQQLYERMQGAKTGENRAPREIQTRNLRHRIEPEVEAHEGPITSRMSERPVQGITSKPASEESRRQEKVVKQRPDAQAGVNHTPKRKSSR